eukprot:TRINITY_DN9876_c0_g1_i1.p1 TRINITY_DN9876_c0_g1~~TRINITY_DN9876_c0_g1_i1.p1  ORF type:complete len:817 (-),score=222.32 TRINITY_DN9876_c0_g1_i1:318-2768(-)
MRLSASAPSLGPGSRASGRGGQDTGGAWLRPGSSSGSGARWRRTPKGSQQAAFAGPVGFFGVSDPYQKLPERQLIGVGGSSGSRPGSRGGVTGVRDWLLEPPEKLLEMHDLGGTLHSTMSGETLAPGTPYGCDSRPGSAWHNQSKMLSSGVTDVGEDSLQLTRASGREEQQLRGINLLTGLTWAADLENGRVAWSEQVALARANSRIGAKGQGLMKRTVSGGRTGGGKEADLEDVQDFVMLSDSLFGSIDELRSRHQAFEGPLLTRDAGRLKKSRSVSKVQDTEDLQKLRERLAAYKMSRRLEPELPPLVYQPRSKKRDKKVTDIVEKNQTAEALRVYRPAVKQEVQKDRSERQQMRTQHALTHAEEIQEARMHRLAEDIQRRVDNASKQRQIRDLMARQLRATGFSGHEWFKWYAAAVFAKKLQKDLKYAKMSAAERKAMADAKAAAVEAELKAKDRQLQEKKVELEPATQVDVTVSIGVLVALARAKISIKSQREKAKKVFKLLDLWRSGASFVIGCRKIINKVRRLQGHWRLTLKSIREVKQKISLRWIQLEKEDLMKEHEKVQEIAKRHAEAERPTSAQPPPAVKGKKKSPAQEYTLDERLAFEAIPEASRIRFIDNEMRARRFISIAAYDFWKEETRRWEQARQEYRKMTELRKDFGGTCSDGQMHDAADSGFSWPPQLVSYVPHMHGFSTCPRNCPEGCQGSRGDAEILAMIKACRAHPEGGGWKAIPVCRTTTQRPPQDGDASLRVISKDSAKLAKAEAPRPFGVADDKDLVKWDLDPAAMPGADGPKGIRALAADAEVDLQSMPAPSL